MNTFKKTGGFTLVELIIVIAILAILSSVAVAGYFTYIKRANDSAVNTELSNILTSVTLANAKEGNVTSIEVTVADKTVTIEVIGATEDTEFGADVAASLSATNGGYDENTDTWTFTYTTKANWTATTETKYSTNMIWTSSTSAWNIANAG